MAPSENNYPVISVSDDLIMSRAQVKESSWMPPSAARIAWDEMDWDAHIENPPKPKKKGVIKVFFKYIGRSKPIRIGVERKDEQDGEG